MNSHSKAEEKLEQIKKIQNAHQMHYFDKKETSVRKEKHQILISEFGENRIQRQISISERDPDQQQERKIPKCTTVR